MRTLLLLLGGVAAAALGGCGGGGLEGCTHDVHPEDDVFAIQGVLDTAPAGSTICFHAGTYALTEGLRLATNGITLKGEGDRTVLDFAGMIGPKAFDVTGDDFTAESFVIKNTPGDGIDVTGATNVTFRKLKVYWDAGSVTDNGAYAIFPVNCDNVLVEDCEIIGASDAGIYVGQSRKIIVRGNNVHGNVAGIEIENSQDAEVYDNEAWDNTGGILVFNLPNLPVKDGRRTIVRGNDVHDNNRENFAEGGSIVASVPTGTGVIIMSNDEIEVYDNAIHDNASTGLAIASYVAIFPPPDNDPEYDAYPETIFIHDNTFTHNGYQPMDLLTLPQQPMLEDILWDGFVDPMKDPTDPTLKICIMDNGSATFRNVDGDDFMMQSTDITPHLCTHPPLPHVMF